MVKSGEKTYFKKIGTEGIAFTLGKPFSDPSNTGSLLHDISAVFSLLPPTPANIIDIGCGSGWTSSFYAKAGYKTVGVDIAPEAIKAAKLAFKDLSNLSFRTIDYDNMKYKDEFDAAIFFDSLHHAENEINALSAAYNALKPGGILICCEPGVGHSRTTASIEAMEKYNVNERDMPPKLLIPQLKKVGFQSISTYAYPAIVHRSLYKQRTGLMGAVRNTAFIRALTTAALATILRRQHGIVIAKK